MDATEAGNDSNIQLLPERPPKRQRASRKGQPRRFLCPHEGCEKKYSRAEHLARHELNHSPKELFQCSVEGCGDTFVRSDLFARHKRKHDKSASTTEDQSPLHEVARSAALTDTGTGTGAHTAIPSPVSTAYRGDFISDLHAVSNGGGNSSSWIPTVHQPMIMQTPADEYEVMPQQDSQGNNAGMPPDVWSSSREIESYCVGEPTQVNFAEWLLHPPNSQTGDYGDYGLPEFPFLDYSMAYSPADTWSLDQSTLFAPQHQQRIVSGESVPSDAHSRISEDRRSSIARTLNIFLTKKRPATLSTVGDGGLLLTTDHHSFPNITTQVLERHLAAFWQDVTKQISIIHQATFDTSQCNQYLLLAMLALGAAQLVRVNPKGTLDDHKDLADLIMTNLRWEIFTDDDAQPPMQLWAAQALLLLELYEKMYSTRRLHERAHIHHASTITLLRRGSPLLAREGSETPPSGMPTGCGTPIEHGHGGGPNANADSAQYCWRQWSRIESMNRVVFAAFQMDALHAVLFGHESALFPYEIRLRLPCDDILWGATTYEEVQRLESSFSMHGIRPVNFLDGLKRCLHGQEVHSHHDGRTILMSGLLSVNWHLNQREKHLQFLETVPPAQEQERWRSLLHNAYSSWRRSFEQALAGSKSRRGGRSPPADCVSDPAVMFHLANITARVDIIDLQVLAGSKRLLGRKVSNRDHMRVAFRMRQWAASEISRTAVLHAFKLLHETLMPAASSVSTAASHASFQSQYSCRSDPSIYRPWVLYLAGLTIWASQYADAQSVQPFASQEHRQLDNAHEVALRYISTCATIENAERLPIVTSTHGCYAALQLLSEELANAEPELLVEASKRLRQCQALFSSTTFMRGT